MMDNEALQALIMEHLEAIGITCATEEIADKETIVAEYTGESEDLPEDCTITVENLTEDSTEIGVLITVFSGFDETQTVNVARVVGELNKYLQLGCFSVIDDGALFLNYCFVLDEEMGVNNMLAAFLASLDAVSAAAIDAKQQLLPLVKGEVTVEQLLEDGLYVEQ